MSIFKKNTIEFSPVKEGTKLSFTFELEQNVTIVNSVPVCGCTNVKHSSKGLEGTLNVGFIPDHLNMTGLDIKKNIQVQYKELNSNNVYFETVTLKTKILK